MSKPRLTGQGRSLGSEFQRNFLYWLERSGIWVVYGRTDRRFPCINCYDIYTHDARIDCEDCFGTGYKTTLERWFGYYTDALERLGPLSRVQLQKPGIVEEQPSYLITRHFDIPVIGDKVFIVEWNQPRDKVPELGGQVIRLFKPLYITFVEHEFAGESGLIVSYCNYHTEASKQYERALLRTPITKTSL